MTEINAEFLKFILKENEILFQTTHDKLCIPIIRRIYLKMMNGLKFDEIKVYENLIIDGHHRYVSSLIASYNIEKVSTHKTSATKIFNWDEIEFVEEDWDTKEKIIDLNRRDADYNNISIDAINDMVFGKNSISL